MKGKFKRNQLDGVFENFLLACRVEGKSPFTIKFYHYELMVFKIFLSQQNIKGIQGVSPNHIRLFLLELQKRGSRPSTIHGYYAALSVFFNWLQAEKVIKQSPLQNIKRPRIPKRNVRAFSKQDIQSILALVSGNRFSQVRSRAMILLLMDTGLRLNELAKIELRDMDFEHEIIRVMGKGARERVVRMGRIAQGVTLHYITLRHSNHPHLWVTKGGMPLKREGVQAAIRAVCCKANINGAKPGPHTFRHTAAIHCLRNGMDMMTLKQMLGHARLDMTERYLSSLSEEDMIKAHRKFSPVDNLIKCYNT